MAAQIKRTDRCGVLDEQMVSASVTEANEAQASMHRRGVRVVRSKRRIVFRGEPVDVYAVLGYRSPEVVAIDEPGKTWHVLTDCFGDSNLEDGEG
jgi:hypothetical protein